MPALLVSQVTRFLSIMTIAAFALAAPADAQWMLPDSTPAPAVAQPIPGTDSTITPAPQESRAKNGRQARANPKPAAYPYPYYIEFRSRNAISYGHSFVMFGRLDSRGNMIPGEVTGLHPAGGTSEYVAGHYLPVPAETGPSDGDTEEEYLNARYRIDLTAEQYQRLVGFIRQKQASSKMWHAVLNNCNGYVGDIANFLGLQAPSHLHMPPEFINGIKRMNNGVSRISLPGAAGGFASEPALN